jgi:hypothetical protein
MVEMGEAIDIHLAGADHRVTRREFEQRVGAAQPERIQKYSGRVGARRYPIKQAVAVGVGVPRVGFQSQEAFRVLQRLGYQPEERAGDV